MQVRLKLGGMIVVKSRIKRMVEETKLMHYPSLQVCPTMRRSGIEMNGMILSKKRDQSCRNKCTTPIVFAKKIDGALRFGNDFCKIVVARNCDCNVVPWMDEDIDILGDAKVSASLNVKNTFWHVKDAESDQNAAIFTIRHEHYRFSKMGFGLRNALNYFSVHNACNIIVSITVINSRESQW